MTEKLKRSLCLLLATAMVLTMTACGKDKEDEADDNAANIDPNQSTVAVKAQDDLFSLGYDPDASLNPLTTKSSANYIVDCLVYEFAVELDQDYNPIPNVISAWDTDNGTSWFFTIDTSITFHDGTNVTAADVAYSLNRARSNDVYAARLNKIWGISAMDEDTLMITLADTNYMFPRCLNVPVVKADSDSKTPPGTGPYVFSEDKTKLEKYEDYRFVDDTPIDVIYLQPNGTPEEKIADYSTSVLDLVINDPTSLSRLGFGSNNEIRHFPTTNMQYIGFNMEGDFTCYSTYRYAFNYIVDREYIVHNILNDSAAVATMPISPVNSLYNHSMAERYKFDRIMALNALNGAGVQDYDNDGMLEYQLPGGIAEIELDFVVPSDNTDKVKAAKRIAEDLTAIGVPVKVRQLSWTDYLNAIVEGDYDMFYGEIRLTADFNLTDMLTTNGLKNFYNITDPNFYEVIHAFLKAPSETERRQMCDAMCQYIVDQAPIIPICFEEQQVLTHRDVVSGLEPTQFNVFYNFRNWTINLGDGVDKKLAKEQAKLEGNQTTESEDADAEGDKADKTDVSPKPSASPAPTASPEPSAAPTETGGDTEAQG